MIALAIETQTRSEETKGEEFLLNGIEVEKQHFTYFECIASISLSTM
jgi:hypothetical protein